MLFNSSSFFILYSSIFLLTFILCTVKLYYNIGSSILDRFMVTDIRILNLILFFMSLLFIYGLDIINNCLNLDLLFFSNDNFVFNISDDNKINMGQNATVNVQASGGVVEIKVDHVAKAAAAISMAGGATAGLQVAKYIGGPPAVKVAAGIATTVTVQAGTAIMSKILSTDKNDKTNLVAHLIASNKNTNILEDYPLNLLTDMNTLIICGLVFLYIIFNVYISKYIISKDVVRYIPKNNKVTRFICFWLDKYLNLWSKNSNYFLIFCYIMLLFIMLMSKLVLYIILTY